MKFTILSHAGLLVEHSGARIVCDPWLLGSCYWRSWWNFPEPDPALTAELRADFIYLTHLHWDHFHGPSLRRLFSPKTRVLVPKVPTRRMVEDLHYLGFKDVVEIPHGNSFELAPDFRLRSYQFGLGVDSAAVLAGGGVTLFNCNDAKLFGMPLRQILRDFPRIDFLLRSHSSAGPIPYCVENYERLPRETLVQGDSADQFVRCALHVGARYAIPFASNHCFLHRETIGFNGTATTPEDVRTRYREVAASVGSSQTECVVMPPGSSWSDRDGFRIQSFDFAARSGYIDSMLARHGDKLAATYAEEDRAGPDLDSFLVYFERMMAAIPRFIRRRFLAPITFEVRAAAGRRFWRIDPAVPSVAQLPAPLAGDVVFEVHAAVLRDCTRNRMFSVWSASKRLKIKLPAPQALAVATRWLTFLDLYELETFPLSSNLAPRSLAVRLRRWREPVELATLMLRRALGRRPLTIASLYPIRAA
ncbi:MAG TPA: MBL fold metallo-hydrolase [Steroidobacteraceae bacterium]|nr:MBL fold metallo-hydrolase [Steroidobacteraceae bacterium]